MHIPSWPQADGRESELLQEVLASPQWGGFHPFVAQFEERFAAFQHSKHGIGAFNGTVTLELALTVLGIGPGDEVIVPAISFVSTALAVSRVGAVPVFVDIEKDSYNLNPELASAAITSKTKALMAVHFGGIPCNLNAITELCRERDLLLIEDAAHAQGSEWRGQRAGSFGIAGSFSFQNGKVLCSGEGGMLVSSNNAFAEQARSIVNCGRVSGRSFYEHHRLGTNFRMAGFQAAVLLAQLERLPGQIARRTENAALLKKLLAEVTEVVWQSEPAEMTACSWYLLVGRAIGGAGARAEVLTAMASAGVPCASFYPHTLYQNPVYRTLPCVVHPCPEAEARVEDAFWFPHRVLLAEPDVIEGIAGVLRSAAARVTSP